MLYLLTSSTNKLINCRHLLRPIRGSCLKEGHTLLMDVGVSREIVEIALTRFKYGCLTTQGIHLPPVVPLAGANKSVTQILCRSRGEENPSSPPNQVALLSTVRLHCQGMQPFSTDSSDLSSPTSIISSESILIL